MAEYLALICLNARRNNPALITGSVLDLGNFGAGMRAFMALTIILLRHPLAEFLPGTFWQFIFAEWFITARLSTLINC